MLCDRYVSAVESRLATQVYPPAGCRLGWFLLAEILLCLHSGRQATKKRVGFFEGAARNKKSEAARIGSLVRSPFGWCGAVDLRVVDTAVTGMTNAFRKDLVLLRGQPGNIAPQGLRDQSGDTLQDRRGVVFHLLDSGFGYRASEFHKPV